MPYRIGHLRQLEAEAIYVLREAAAQLQNPVLLFSGGKDSTVLAILAARAFHPGTIPFPFLHIDTGQNFPETLEFRDTFCERLGVKLIVREVQESIDRGRVREETGDGASRNSLQSVTLLDAIGEFEFDGVIAGGRRDEEKARAKERVFSFRNTGGGWDPENQRPELWNIYNARRNPGEHFRIFPLSNWTELDVWHYVLAEQIELPLLYFSHRREVVARGGLLLANGPYLCVRPGETVEKRMVRFRTIGDMTCSGATDSRAGSPEDVVAELEATSTGERYCRADDNRGETAMEDRKREGFF
jgi:sulfate adenylyltransferase subunit 2